MSCRLTREQLYELVWSLPMRQLSKQIGISDVALAKHCRKMAIPVPERGYWNKLQAGKTVVKAELTPRDLGTINSVDMQHGTFTPELQQYITGEPGVSNIEEDIAELTARFRERLGKVTVPRRFSKTHPAIAALLAKDEKIRQEIARSSYSWRTPQFETPFEKRRLGFLNGLFLAAASVGGGGWTRGDRAQELYLNLGNVHVSFTLDKIPLSRNRRETIQAQGQERLRLQIETGSPFDEVITQWEDGENSQIEDRLTEIVVGMAVTGEHLRRHWIKQQLEWKRQQREEAARRALEAKREAERKERERLAAIAKAKVDALCADAAAWRQAETIRAYIEVARKTVAGQVEGDAVERWVAWANVEADKIDPFASKRLLNQVIGAEIS